MTQRRAMIGGVVMGLLAAMALAALLLIGLGPTAAAPPAANPAAAPATAPGAPTAVEAVAASTPDTGQHYAALLVQNFAGRLGTDPARLNSAFSAAANDTIDQAVRDGQLTQDAAAKAKAQASQGLGGIFMNGFRTDTSQGGAGAGAGDQGEMGAAAQAVVPAIAPLLGLTADTLPAALKSGQTLASLEQAHHVTDQQVQSAALAAIRSALNAGVPKGQWTQADADKTYQVFQDNIGNFLLKITGAGGAAGDARPNGAAGPQDAAFQGASEAVAGLFGMHFNALLPALRDGQTTLLTLEQAHGVTEQQVHDTALAAAHAALTHGVQAGQWSQADADSIAADFTTHLYDYLAKIRNATAMPALVEAARGAVAALFGLTDATFQDAIKSGQTVPTLAQAHHVTAAQMRDAAVAAARTRLASGVQNKEWTQAQADDATLVFGETLDEMLSGNLGVGMLGTQK